MQLGKTLSELVLQASGIHEHCQFEFRTEHDISIRGLAQRCLLSANLANQVIGTELTVTSECAKCSHTDNPGGKARTRTLLCPPRIRTGLSWEM